MESWKDICGQIDMRTTIFNPSHSILAITYTFHEKVNRLLLTGTREGLPLGFFLFSSQCKSVVAIVTIQFKTFA